ncbi:MAG: formylglycine-generating enzyme family protein [Prevotellaceae bacterium]|jgi:formylglycine-generating enzyme required for sulfatase activity|nr:formylglycine-generating enzyme family protein [Prevotellaceae bacterium]
MKQNYKIYLAVLLLVGAVNMLPVGAQAASMAVLVVGLESDAASDAFAASIRYEYTQKGSTMVTSAAVSAKQTELRNLHKQNQPVDTAGLAAWGKTNSIDFVQLVVEKGGDLTISGREQVAQVVTCGTTKYTGRSYYRMRFAAHGTVPCECECECGDGECEYGGIAVGVMIPVVGGVFEMGRKSDRDGSGDGDELPVHWVSVNSFNIGKYEVTQALWKAVMDSLPSSLDSIYLGDNKPIVFVSWDDVAGSGGFLEKLNAKTGKNYRLPTEAEWEYAARGCNAGVCESFVYSGNDSAGNVAWYSGAASSGQVVGGKLPNALGIHDMSGNVWEWCSDWYGTYPSGTTASNPQDNPTGPDIASYRIYRGGSWAYSSFSSRIANRPAYEARNSGRSGYYGFRLVLP